MFCEKNGRGRNKGFLFSLSWLDENTGNLIKVNLFGFYEFGNGRERCLFGA